MTRRRSTSSLERLPIELVEEVISWIEGDVKNLRLVIVSLALPQRYGKTIVPLM
ncbi:hypothetical protein PM082_002518 [Marasmius tenuissimus]|nr:hypothetical protein PM082_002518 [Marasmius tenuissimus]